jgi:hypothetical protein
MTDHQQETLIGRDAMAETREDGDLNAPVEWAGLPAFHPIPERKTQLILSFDTDEQRDELITQLGIVIAKKTGKSWSAWWPPREREDLAALRFDFGAEAQGEEDGGL